MSDFLQDYLTEKQMIVEAINETHAKGKDFDLKMLYQRRRLSFLQIEHPIHTGLAFHVPHVQFEHHTFGAVKLETLIFKVNLEPAIKVWWSVMGYKDKNLVTPIAHEPEKTTIEIEHRFQVEQFIYSFLP